MRLSNLTKRRLHGCFPCFCMSKDKAFIEHKDGPTLDSSSTDEQPKHSIAFNSENCLRKNRIDTAISMQTCRRGRTECEAQLVEEGSRVAPRSPNTQREDAMDRLYLKYLLAIQLYIGCWSAQDATQTFRSWRKSHFHWFTVAPFTATCVKV